MTTNFLETTVRQARVIEETMHRPWPLPRGHWVNAQSWERLAFLHWPVDAAALRRLVPAGLELDLYDGVAYIGITPFEVTGFRPRGGPPLPAVSSFPELNVRTYVTRDDKPGIWFFSLDAGSRLAVEGARRLYKLPYFRAAMSVTANAVEICYRSQRPGAVLSARYRRDGAPVPAPPGSLERFLTERYCLYTAQGGVLYRAEIHHPPWPLRTSSATIEQNTMSPPGVELPEAAPLVHYAARQDVLVWPLQRI